MPERHSPDRLAAVVLISGSGTNLQAILDAIERDRLPVEVRAVISNRAAAYGLERARRAGIATEVLEHKGYPDRLSYDRALIEHIDRHRPGLVALAGFMRILTPEFVRHYDGRILNIHPSLLPDLPGLQTHERALAAGHAEHGVSVHFVTEQLDGGPVIARARVAVHPGDDAEALARRVQEKEHLLYPLVLRWFAEGRLSKQGETVMFDGKPLDRPLDYAQAARTMSNPADTGTAGE